ncbi:MAG TPA: CGLD27 family protein, partial [Thermosynechococcaceae cyanobacterium]
GWTYIQSRLSAATIFYEESGWYDGQLWAKPPAMLAQDQLVVTYQIQPILKRLTRTFGVLAIAFVAGVVVWQLL